MKVRFSMVAFLDFHMVSRGQNAIPRFLMVVSSGSLGLAAPALTDSAEVASALAGRILIWLLAGFKTSAEQMNAVRILSKITYL